jgi:beta-carotene 3-hydroxylase
MQLSHLVLVIATLLLMELAVTLFHKHVMHGTGWRWHASHHEARPGSGWERNDWFGVVFSCATVLLFALGGFHQPIWWIALGITLYGVLYGLLHDVVTHRRFGMKWQPKNAYLRRLVTAHRLHHAIREREGGVSFGFLYAPPVETVRRQLRARRSRT